ncbi:MAG: hypothetical protein AAF847_08405 [Bacteroidota bacterium]
MRKDYSSIQKAIRTLCFLAVFAWNSNCYAQQKILVDYHFVLQEIEQKLRTGDLFALRDAALLLERATVKADALETLKRYTLFSPRELKLTNFTTKRIFLDFFYKNQDRIRFSIPLKAFYITPFAERNLSYKVELIEANTNTDLVIRLREHIALLEKAVEMGDQLSAETQIRHISELRSLEAAQYLGGLVMERSFRRKHEVLSKKIIEELTHYHESASLKILLYLLEKDAFPKAFLSDQLTRLTNVQILGTQKAEQYAYLLDSLGSIQAMRQYGYDQQFQFRPAFFTDTVDYHGKILLVADSLIWLQENVVEDIISSHQPQALYYLAAKIYRLALKKEESDLKLDALYQKMQSLLSTRLLITDQNYAFIETPDWENDLEAAQNFIHYWTIHYDNYEWDKYRGKFINKTLSQTLEKRYKLYIQQLNSSNDSVAWEAYLKLTEGEPQEVIRITERFRHVLTDHNPKLPPLEYAYLERLSELTAFCRRNKILYKPNKTINSAVDSLILNLKPATRYDLEKRLLASIKITDLTAIEYLACLYAQQKELSYSLAWILDRSYTKYWNAIISDDQQLRLYLKKAYLFSRIGTDGICNFYLNKLDITSDETRLRLKQLLELETDKDVIYQVEKLLAQQAEIPERTWEDLMIEDFDIGLLNMPKTEELPAIFEQLQKLSDSRTQLKIIFYLSLHPSVEQTPHLMKLLRIASLEKEAISLLENIYAYDFQELGIDKKEQWLAYWERNQSTYKNWGTQFVELQINQANAKQKISIYELNAITQSPYYKSIYRNICLSMLKKVYPTRNIKRLRMDYKLKASTELRYLNSIDFSSRTLLNVTKISYVDDHEALLDFFLDKISGWSNFEQTEFIVQMINTMWFKDYIVRETLAEKLLDNFKKNLNKYLDSRRVSEQNKIAAAVALVRLEMIGLEPIDRLRLTAKMQVDEKTIATLQAEILQMTTYKDLDAILMEYTKLSPALNYNVFHDHFGLPIFDVSSSDDRVTILNNLQRFKQDSTIDTTSLYKHYLRSFEVDFEDDKGRLDFDKIFELLKYDIVYTFSTNTAARNYYVNSLIKLLELHFQKDLGFGEHFSERTQNSRRSTRAYTWMRFLEQQKAVKEKSTIPNSFTHSYVRPASS